MNRFRKIFTVLLFVPVMMLAQSSTENYIKAETMLNADGNNAMASVQYYNGLGYPTVSVATKRTAFCVYENLHHSRSPWQLLLYGTIWGN